MTKRKGLEDKIVADAEQSSVEYTNTKGIKVILTAIPPFILTSIAKEIPPISRPMYKTKTVAGDELEFYHDETTLTTEDEKKMWATYIDRKEERDSEVNQRVNDAAVAFGMDLEDWSGMDSWLSKRKLIGFKVPEDEEGCKFLYKKEWVLNSYVDVENVIKAIMDLTGPTEEEIAEMKDSFPSELESKS